MTKNITSLLLVLITFANLSFAGNTKFLRPKVKKQNVVNEPSYTQSTSQLPSYTRNGGNSVNDANWVYIDSMPNCYGTGSADINPLSYDVTSHAIAVIHRGHTSVSPHGTSGTLWYNTSADMGTNWPRCGTALNGDVDGSGRYPSAAIANPGNSTNPGETFFEYSYPQLQPGGGSWGLLGIGLDVYSSCTPFTTIYGDASLDYGAGTYIASAEDGSNDVYFVTERTDAAGGASNLSFWKTDNLGETWTEAKLWNGTAEGWTALFAERVHCKGNTVYVEAAVTSTDFAHLYFTVTKSEDGGATWSSWTSASDWPSLSDGYDDIGTIDGRVAHDFVVDANNNYHILFSGIDTTSGAFSILHLSSNNGSWDVEKIADRTNSFITGFSALSQMDNELFASISQDRNSIMVKWVDAPVEGDSAGDIFLKGWSNGMWYETMNVTQTNSGTKQREMQTHIAPRFMKDGNAANVVIMKTTQLADVPDSDLDDTAPTSIWGANVMYNFITGVTEREPGVPTNFALHANYPNPFNPSTTISYDIANAANVSLNVYDITGKEVATLFNGYQAAGKYKVEFNASILASGLYLMKLQAGEFVTTQKIMLSK